MEKNAMAVFKFTAANKQMDAWGGALLSASALIRSAYHA